ncbi:MAG TPA: endonuclease/exonuclease/phosphatase family protein [Candidatus Eisenbacteria bacterium]|nr:endonuclease/exonuclease/phosphatase family protein [Candidatus Eisenbacteria bacterium]
MRDPALLEECRALQHVIERHRTLRELRGSPEWPEMAPRFARVLARIHRHAPDTVSAGPARESLRAVHWNIEHGNWYAQVEHALRHHPALRDADVLFFDEVDLGMARAGNRDVTGDLARALGRHGAWTPLFVETTIGRDDDASTAGNSANEEGLFGIALLSRWPLGEVRRVTLPSPELVQYELERMYGTHAALIAEVLRPGAPFVAVVAHLEVHRTRRHRAEQVATVMRALEGERRPVLMAGDFNTHTFDRGSWTAPLAGAAALLLTPGETLRRRLQYPDQGPQRELLFDELARAGFAWRPFVDDRFSLQLRFARVEELQALLGPLASPAARALRILEPRARLRLDWFAGRGWHAARGETVQGLDGPGRASDHAPIVAEVW